MFEAVFPVTLLAVNSSYEGCIYQSFTSGLGALLLVREDVRSRRRFVGGLVRLCSFSSPFAGVGAFVCGFGAVIKAEFAMEGNNRSAWSSKEAMNPVARSLTHPLQLSHRKGKKSSCRQNDIWQCAPIASTSPNDISLQDWSLSVDSDDFEFAMAYDTRWI